MFPDLCRQLKKLFAEGPAQRNAKAASTGGFLKEWAELAAKV
jgi:hypothetical protein